MTHVKQTHQQEGGIPLRKRKLSYRIAAVMAAVILFASMAGIGLSAMLAMSVQQPVRTTNVAPGFYAAPDNGGVR